MLSFSCLVQAVVDTVHVSYFEKAYCKGIHKINDLNTRNISPAFLIVLLCKMQFPV